MPSHVVSRASIGRWRAVAAAVLLVAAWNHAVLSDAVAYVWAAMYSSPIVQHDTFEPILSSLSFGLWINMFRVIDKFGTPFHKYRLLGPPKPDTFTGLDHGIKALAAYIVPLFVFDTLYPRRKLPLVAPSFPSLVAQVVLSIFVYDFCFFWIHLALHKVRSLYHLHAKHHFKSPMNASEVIRHSFIDGSLQVVTNIFVLNVLRLHPLARAVHDVTITYMLTETHSGYDMPWMLHNLMPCGILGGSPRHEMHHRSGMHYFQQFYTYLDNIMGYVRSQPPFQAPMAVRTTDDHSCSGTPLKPIQESGGHDSDSSVSAS